MRTTSATAPTPLSRRSTAPKLSGWFKARTRPRTAARASRCRFFAFKWKRDSGLLGGCRPVPHRLRPRKLGGRRSGPLPVFPFGDIQDQNNVGSIVACQLELAVGSPLSVAMTEKASASPDSTFCALCVLLRPFLFRLAPPTRLPHSPSPLPEPARITPAAWS